MKAATLHDAHVGEYDAELSERERDLHYHADQMAAAADAARDRELAREYMELLEERLVHEIKYPDWHPDADALFERIENNLSRVAHEIAARATRSMFTVRMIEYTERNTQECERRGREFDAAIAAERAALPL